MPAIILQGRKARDVISKKLKDEIQSLGISPCLVIFQVGNNPGSDVYVEQKIFFGTSIGINVRHERIEEGGESEEKIIARIEELNHDDLTHGIIVQLPLPIGINKEKIFSTIIPTKDVDGLHPENLGLLLKGIPRFVPATARGVFSLLDFYQIPVESKHVVVVGRSDLVGKPVGLVALLRGATVTVCHSKTENLSQFTKTADIIIVATGKKGLIGLEHVSPGQVVVDVGIHAEVVDGKKIFSGDVLFDEVKDVVGAITPVPGGVGPMTVLSLFENLLDAFKEKM